MKSLETSAIDAGLAGRILNGAERFIPPLKRYMQSRRERQELPRLMDAVSAHFFRQMVTDGFTTSHEGRFTLDTETDTKPLEVETWYTMHTFSRTPSGSTYYAGLRWQEIRGGQSLSLEVSSTFPQNVNLPVTERIFRIEKSVWDGTNIGRPGTAVYYDFWNINVTNWNEVRYSENMRNSEAVSFLKELLKTTVDHDAVRNGYEDNTEWLADHPQLKSVFWNRGKYPDLARIAPFSTP